MSIEHSEVKTLEAYLNALAAYQIPPACADNIIRNTTKHFPAECHMLLGHEGGNVLRMIVALIDARVVVEIGTFTGFSASYLADALSPTARLITIEKNKSFQEYAKLMLSQHPHFEQIKFHLGDGTEMLNSMSMPIDLIFIDANKKAYKEQYIRSKKLLSSKGVIVVDNALFHGEVIQATKNKIATHIHEFNLYVSQDQEVYATLLPIRDGMWLIKPKNEKS